VNEPSESSTPHRRGNEFRAARAATNSLVRAGGVVCVLLIALVTTPVALSHLGLVEFGIWSFVTVTVGYISTLDPGFGNMVVRYGARGKVEGDHLIGARITTVGTIAWLCIGLVGLPIVVAVVHPLMVHLDYSPGVQSAAERFFYWTYGLVFFGSMLATLSSRLVAVGEQWIITIIDVLSRLIYAVLLVVLLQHGMRLSAIVIATSTQYAIAYLATMTVIFVRHGMPFASPRGIPLEIRRELRRVTGWFQLNSILETLTYETDPIVISTLVSPAATGLWSIAQRLARQITFFGYIPNGNLLPTISAAVAAEEGLEGLRRIYVRANRIIVLIGIVMAGLVMALGPVLLTAWLNRPFLSASTATILIALGMVVGTPRPATAAAIFAIGKVGLGTRAQLVAFLVNIALTLVLVGPFGLNGVLVGTLCAKICATSYLLIRFSRMVETTARILVVPWISRAIVIGATSTITTRLLIDRWTWALSSRWHALAAAAALTALFGSIALVAIRFTKYFSRDDLLWLRGAMPRPIRRCFPDRAIRLLSAP
jgi:O-antigen/teichoic acid export membrane protein